MSHAYDKAKYHFGGEFPSDLEIEQGFVHTGMFLGWLIDHQLFSEWFGEEMAGEVSAFNAREMSGAKVFEACDGVLTDDMLNDEGNLFAHYYFDFEQGRFLEDYEELLAKGLPSVYHVSDTWENYEKLKKRIDRRYRRWKNEQAGGWRAFLAKFE